MGKNEKLQIASAPRWAVFSLAALALVLALLVTCLLFLPNGARKNPRDAHAHAHDDSRENSRPGYVVVTEMTDAGRALPAPSVAKPVYYLAHTGTTGQRAGGGTGDGAKPVPDSFLQKELESALARNGYRLADAEHPPTQVLIFLWGAHGKIESSADAPDYKNLLSRAKAVGWQKFAGEYERALRQNDLKRFSARDEVTGTLVNEVQNECYYLIVCALDLEALKNNVKKILWTTSLSTVPQGNSVEATAVSIGIIDHAAHFFGRETPPQIVR